MFFQIFWNKLPSRIVNLMTSRYRYSSSLKNSLKLEEIISTMPKDNTKNIRAAQQQRQRIKEKGAKYAPGIVNLQILGSGAHGSPAAVYLFTDQNRYLFNCGEGTQRLAHEHKTKLARLEHIFMTRTSWDRFGGLPGLSLTIQDSGVENITLHGPSRLDEIFTAMKRFVVLRELNVDAINCENGGSYKDQVMSVQYVPLRRKTTCAPTQVEIESQTPEDDEIDYYAHEMNVQKEKSTPKQTEELECYKREENCVISYICKLTPKQGTLNLEKCVEKGVPPGPLLGELKNGYDVTLPNGTTVKAQEVCGATDPGPVIIFLDIPSEDYLPSLVESNNIFAKHQWTAANDGDVALVVLHFSPPEIIRNKFYQEFIEKFSPSTRHLILNSSNKFSGYVAAHRIQWQLNQLNEYTFPLLKESTEFLQSEDEENQRKRIKLSENGSENAATAHQNETKLENEISCMDSTNSLTYYYLRPRKGLDRLNEAVINPKEYLRETHAIAGFTESLEALRLQLEEKYTKLRENRKEEYPKIVFLGTGSCIPNKTRNVSAILVNTSKDSCLLLDCGEGTWGQMIRFYGYRNAVEMLRKLKGIYVSHLHADHHIGLIGILLAKQELFGDSIEPLKLFAPRQISSWLFFYDRRIQEICKTYKLIPNYELINNPLTNSTVTTMDIRSISTCFVPHCPHSFGIAFELNSSESNQPIKITYSGDTMPSDDLLELGKNSTILIHEATMEDELILEARIKMHSTVSQAIEQGKKMNAKYTLLTHFSQRYAKLPRIENSLGDNIGIAFDNMEVTVSDLKHLNLTYPTLKIMFSEHCDEMEQKAIKRAFKNERKKFAERSSSPVR